MRTYPALPPIPEAGLLDAYCDSLSVVVPVARTNLVTNPSVELATTGYTSVLGASLARVTTHAYHGAYSLEVTPASASGSGVFNGNVSGIALTSGTTYAISCKLLGTRGRTYTLAVTNSGGTALVSRTIHATGVWQWIWLIYGETASANRYIYLTKTQTGDTQPYYIDGLQVEACATGEYWPTTYIDGDQPGLIPNQFPPAYTWSGTPHASTSSRSGQTRAGGRVVKLSDLGFLATTIIGLGLAAPQLDALPFAQLDGSQYLTTRKPARTIAIVGRLDGATDRARAVAEAQLASVLDRDRVATRQPLVLMAQPHDARGVPVGDPVRIVAAYQGGLDGERTNLPAATRSLSFTQLLPYVVTHDAGASLTPQTSFTSYYTALRSPAGVWGAMGSDVTKVGSGSTNLRTALFGRDQYLYVGGDFGEMGGVSNTRGIARWDLSTGAWSAMGTGGASGAIVDVLLLDPAGNVYALGTFTDMGGAANSAHAARWNASTGSWTGLNAPGAVSSFREGVFGPDGTLYAVDSGNVVRTYVPSTATWGTLGTASGGSILSMALGRDGYLYVGGGFTSISAVSMTRVGRYTLGSSSPAWQALNGTSPTGSVYGLAVGSDAMIYAATDTTPYFYRYNGQSWTSLGTLGPSGTSSRGVAAGPQGWIYIWGEFSTANGITLPETAAAWNGATTIPLDLDMPDTFSGGSAPVVYVMAQRADGTLFLGRSNGDTSNPPDTGTTIAAATTTVTNTGTAETWPVIRIVGPSSGTARLYQIVNQTTGVPIYLNATINAGETMTLNLDPSNLTFTSDFQGNLIGTILPGSVPSAFRLQPGTNSISVLAGSSSVTITMTWETRMLSLDDAMPRLEV